MSYKILKMYKVKIEAVIARWYTQLLTVLVVDSIPTRESDFFSFLYSDTPVTRRSMSRKFCSAWGTKCLKT